MKPKEKRRIPKTNQANAGGVKAQRDIAAITSKNSPVRRAYEEHGLKPTVAQMQADRTPGIELAGRIVSGLIARGVTTGRVEPVIRNFYNNHPDVIERLGALSGVAINAQ